MLEGETYYVDSGSVDVIRIPYAALGDLSYGGKLHHLLVGSMYIGSGYVKGLRICKVGEVELACKADRDSIVNVELYYVDPLTLREIDHNLMDYDARRVSASILFEGGLVRSIMAETHIVSGGENIRDTGKAFRRLLLALPPLLPPPAEPLSAYPALLHDVKPSSDGRAFSIEKGYRWEAGLVDIYAPVKLIEDWARSVNAELVHVKALVSSRTLVYPLAPVVRS